MTGADLTAADDPQAIATGTLGLTEELRSFVEEMPYERRSILAFVRGAAQSLAPGTSVLDVGAGAAPYRELFAHCEYRRADWAESVHERAAESDIIAPADALPLPEASVQALLLTQVLEHVRDPAAVLHEAARVLVPGGSVFVTVPFVWELHELPHDYWRFTPGSLRALLSDAGFEEIDVRARNDAFTTVAQLLHNLRWAMGRAADGRDPDRLAAADVLDDVAQRIAQLGPLDVGETLPLGWSASGRRRS